MSASLVSGWPKTRSSGAPASGLDAVELRPTRGALLLTACVFVALRLSERLFRGVGLPKGD